MDQAVWVWLADRKAPFTILLFQFPTLLSDHWPELLMSGMLRHYLPLELYSSMNFDKHIQPHIHGHDHKRVGSDGWLIVVRI